MLSLYDALGRRVTTLSAEAGETGVAVPAAAGVYVLRAESDVGDAAVRLVVVR